MGFNRSQIAIAILTILVVLSVLTLYISTANAQVLGEVTITLPESCRGLDTSRTVTLRREVPLRKVVFAVWEGQNQRQADECLNRGVCPQAIVLRERPNQWSPRGMSLGGMAAMSPRMVRATALSSRPTLAQIICDPANAGSFYAEWSERDAGDAGRRVHHPLALNCDRITRHPGRIRSWFRGQHVRGAVYIGARSGATITLPTYGLLRPTERVCGVFRENMARLNVRDLLQLASTAADQELPQDVKEALGSISNALNTLISRLSAQSAVPTPHPARPRVIVQHRDQDALPLPLVLSGMMALVVIAFLFITLLLTDRRSRKVEAEYEEAESAWNDERSRLKGECLLKDARARDAFRQGETSGRTDSMVRLNRSARDIEELRRDLATRDATIDAMGKELNALRTHAGNVAHERDGLADRLSNAQAQANAQEAVVGTCREQVARLIRAHGGNPGNEGLPRLIQTLFAVLPATSRSRSSSRTTIPGPAMAPPAAEPDPAPAPDPAPTSHGSDPFDFDGPGSLTQVDTSPGEPGPDHRAAVERYRGFLGSLLIATRDMFGSNDARVEKLISGIYYTLATARLDKDAETVSESFPTVKLDPAVQVPSEVPDTATGAVHQPEVIAAGIFLMSIEYWYNNGSGGVEWGDEFTSIVEHHLTLLWRSMSERSVLGVFRTRLEKAFSGILPPTGDSLHPSVTSVDELVRRASDSPPEVSTGGEVSVSDALGRLAAVTVAPSGTVDPDPDPANQSVNGV